MSKKILIANLASPENPGDHAILRGTLKAIAEKFDNPEITISTRAISYEDYYFKEGLKAIASYPNVDRLNMDDSLSKFSRLPAALKEPCELREAVKNTDYVLLAGGAYFYSYRKTMPGLTYLAHISATYWAKKYKKPVILLPQSYGPFKSWIAEKLFLYVLSYASKIYYREAITGSYLDSHFPMAQHKSAWMPDLALLLERKDFILKDRPIGSQALQTIGVTLRPWNVGGVAAEVYVERLVEALKQVSQTKEICVKVIVQVMDQKKSEGDEGISKYFVGMLKKKAPQIHVELLCERPFYSLDEICKLYESCDMLIGMRLHSALLSLIVGCPALAVGYQHKAKGILESLNLEKLYLGSYADVSISLLEREILGVLKNKEALKVEISGQLARARKQIYDSFKEFLS